MYSSFEICAAGLDSLENRPFNLFSSKDERKTPNYACRLFTGDALLRKKKRQQKELERVEGWSAA